jgi:hypothetical protein
MFEGPPTIEAAFSTYVSTVSRGVLFAIVLSFIMLFYFTDVLRPLFLNLIEIDIT